MSRKSYKKTRPATKSTVETSEYPQLNSNQLSLNEFTEEFLYSEPHVVANRWLNSYQKRFKYANRDRKCIRSCERRDNRRWQDIRIEEIRNEKGKSSNPRRIESHLEIGGWDGSSNFPPARSNDSMCIKTPREDIEKQSINDFPSGTIEYTISYGISQGICELSEVNNVGFYSELPWQPMMGNYSSFKNPTTESPMKASEFLNHLDLSNVLDIVKERYGDKDWHYRFPTEAMIKSLIFKYIRGLRWDTALLRHLDQYPEDS